MYEFRFGVPEIISLSIDTFPANNAVRSVGDIFGTNFFAKVNIREYILYIGL
jgi:hypothetical protein